jgi:hypothetical protein
MGVLDKILGKEEKSVEDLEEDLEKLKIQTDIQGARTELEERKALERELKSKYGSSWKKILGLKGWISVPTLKSALKEQVGTSTRSLRGRGL